jgi:hypothetical protein
MKNIILREIPIDGIVAKHSLRRHDTNFFIKINTLIIVLIRSPLAVKIIDVQSKIVQSILTKISFIIK